MAWEKRERGSSYYYRAVRDGEKVGKEYVGTGPVAELAAQMDGTRREQREVERNRRRHELEQVKALSAPVLELDHAAAVLARAHLVAGGYRRHKGEWRMRRDA